MKITLTFITLIWLVIHEFNWNIWGYTFETYISVYVNLHMNAYDCLVMAYQTIKKLISNNMTFIVCETIKPEMFHNLRTHKLYTPHPPYIILYSNTNIIFYTAWIEVRVEWRIISGVAIAVIENTHWLYTCS